MTTTRKPACEFDGHRHFKDPAPPYRGRCVDCEEAVSARHEAAQRRNNTERRRRMRPRRDERDELLAMVLRLAAVVDVLRVHVSNLDPRCAYHGDFTCPFWNKSDEGGQRCEEDDCQGCTRLLFVEMADDALADARALAGTEATERDGVRGEG